MTMTKNLMGNSSIFKAALRLGLVAILAGYLILANHAQADGMFGCNLGQSSDGTTTWLSCGSSAGNFMYTCDSSGNCNAFPDNQYNQGLADFNCSKYASEGCPEPLESDPIHGIAPLD